MTTETSQKTWIQIQNEPVEALQKLDLKLAASRHIRDDHGLTFFNITGNQQSGKSAYGMLILYELFEGDVDQVMDHIVMSAKDFVEKINNALNGGYREKCLMWDDLSVTGSAATWMTDPKFVIALAGLGDTLGVACKSVILSSPSGNMIKAFRDYQKYLVQIHQGSGKYGRVALGYWNGRSPMQQRYCSSVFKDEYDTRIPFYERYAKKRKEISIRAAQELMKITQAQEESEEKPKPLTIKDRVLELKRDLDAGVYGDMSFKKLCKAHKINYGTACNYL